MQTSEKNQVNKFMHRRMQVSTTLNRKYTKRPLKITTDNDSDASIRTDANMDTSANSGINMTKQTPKIHRISTASPMTRASRQQHQQANTLYQRKQSKRLAFASQTPARADARGQGTTMTQQAQTLASLRAEPSNGPIDTMGQSMMNVRIQTAPQAQAGIVTVDQTEPQVAQIVQTGQNLDMAQSQNQKQDWTQAENQVQIAPVAHPLQEATNTRMKARSEARQKSKQQKLTAKELKEQAIQKALTSASNLDTTKETSKLRKFQRKSSAAPMESRLQFGAGRVLLALSCAAVAVFAIVYFVNLSMPDISLRVAAMQTGMDPTYPNYVPRDFSITSVTSESGKITMEFNNKTTGDSFSLSEEKSSWDTSALASNYVKPEYGENYSIIREQGLTIYINNSDAAWTNKGMVYKIKTTSGSLTNKQIRSIAVSL